MTIRNGDLNRFLDAGDRPIFVEIADVGLDDLIGPTAARLALIWMARELRRECAERDRTKRVQELLGIPQADRDAFTNATMDLLDLADRWAR